MSKKLILVLLAGLVTLIGTGLTLAQDDSAPVGTFEEAACFFELFSGGALPDDIICGYVTVPEQHADPDGPTIRLAVVILPSTAEAPAAPLFMAQGGPGGSSIDIFAAQEVMIGSSLGEAVRETRDVVLVDQRGTLYSEPFLRCDEFVDLTYDTVEQDIPDEEFEALADDAFAACRDRLVSEGVNLSAYDSVENAADMDLVRQTLGYDQIVFYGVSYGTLLGQHMMRDFPETLEAVILDAVVATSVDFMYDAPPNAMRAFDLLFDSCAADSRCSSTYGDLEALFYDTVAALEAEPAVVPMQDILNTGETFDVVFDGDSLAALTFQLLYVGELIPVLPLMIQQASNGSFTIPSLIGGILIFDFSLADGMYNSVVCAEELDQHTEPVEVPEALSSTLSLEGLEEDCAFWGADPLPPSVDDPVVSDIPTLLLSGEFDPITPPRNADIVAQTLSNVFNYTLPGGGHGALFSDCGEEIALQFLADPTTAPDTSCLDDLGISFQ